MVDVLRNAGVEVIGLVSIFNYGFNAAQEAFKKAGVELESLTNYESLIKLAIEKNIVSEDAEHLLQSWREDPAAWGA